MYLSSQDAALQVVRNEVAYFCTGRGRIRHSSAIRQGRRDDKKPLETAGEDV